MIAETLFANILNEDWWIFHSVQHTVLRSILIWIRKKHIRGSIANIILGCSCSIHHATSRGRFHYAPCYSPKAAILAYVYLDDEHSDVLLNDVLQNPLNNKYDVEFDSNIMDMQSLGAIHAPWSLPLTCRLSMKLFWNTWHQKQTLCYPSGAHLVAQNLWTMSSSGVQLMEVHESLW